MKKESRIHPKVTSKKKPEGSSALAQLLGAKRGIGGRPSWTLTAVAKN